MSWQDATNKLCFKVNPVLSAFTSARRARSARSALALSRGIAHQTCATCATRRCRKDDFQMSFGHSGSYSHQGVHNQRISSIAIHQQILRKDYAQYCCGFFHGAGKIYVNEHDCKLEIIAQAESKALLMQ